MKDKIRIISLGMALIVLASATLTGCSAGKNSGGERGTRNHKNQMAQLEDQELIDEDAPIEEQDPYALPESIFSVPDNYDVPLQDTVYGHTVKMNYFSSATGKYRKADVLLPYDYDPTVQYPVLYLLHGLGGDNTSWGDMNAEYIIDNLNFTDNIPEMIVVCPNTVALPRITDDMSEAELLVGFDSFIDDLRGSLMPFINKNFSVRKDRDGTAIAGYSYGAREALYIGFAMQETFGYIGAFSPTSGVVPGVNEDYDTPTLLDEFYVDPDIGDYHLILMDVGTYDEDDCINATAFYGQYFDALGIDYISYYVDGGHDPGVWMNGLYNFVKRLFLNPEE